MTERGSRFPSTKEFLRKKAPTLILVPLLTSCGTSLADADHPRPPREFPIYSYCKPEMTGKATTTEMPLDRNNGHNFDLLLVDGQTGLVNQRFADEGTVVHVIAQTGKLKRDEYSEQERIVDVPKFYVTFTVKSSDRQVTVTETCIK